MHSQEMDGRGTEDAIEGMPDLFLKLKGTHVPSYPVLAREMQDRTGFPGPPSIIFFRDRGRPVPLYEEPQKEDIPEPETEALPDSQGILHEEQPEELESPDIIPDDYEPGPETRPLPDFEEGLYEGEEDDSQHPFIITDDYELVTEPEPEPSIGLVKEIPMKIIKDVFGFKSIWRAIGLCRLLGLKVYSPVKSYGKDIKDTLVVDVFDFVTEYENRILTNEECGKNIMKYAGRNAEEIWEGLASYFRQDTASKDVTNRSVVMEDTSMRQLPASKEQHGLGVTDAVGKIRDATGLDIRSFDLNAYVDSTGGGYPLSHRTADDALEFFSGLEGDYGKLSDWRAENGILEIRGMLYKLGESEVIKRKKIRKVPAWIDEKGYVAVGAEKYALDKAYVGLKRGKRIDIAALADERELLRPVTEFRLNKS